MVKKLLSTLLALFVGALLLLGTAVLFREPLLKFGANRALAESQITITTLSGLQLDTHHAALAELEVTLPSGQILSVGGIDLRFILRSLGSAPILESLDVTSVQLTGETQADTEASTSSLLLSELLTLLRDFPLPSIAVDELVVPQWHEALRLALQRDVDGLRLDLSSGALHLLAQFTQTDAATPAQLQASLTRLDAILGELLVTLEPGQDTYALAGSGRLVFTDLAALLGELQQATTTLPLRNLATPPLQSADLSWSLSGNVADDLYGTLAGTDPTNFVFGLSGGSTFTVPATPAANLGQSTVTFPGDVVLTVATGAGMGVSAGQVPLQVASSYAQQPVSLNGTLTLTNCLLDASTACNLDFTGNAAYGEYAMNGALALTAPGLGVDPGAYRVKTTNLTLSGLPPEVPAFDVDATLTLTDSALTFTTPLLLRDAPVPVALTVSGDYSLTNGAGNAQLAMPQLEFMEGTSPLSAWLSEWPYPADLLAGSVESIAIDAHWQADAALTADIKASLQDIGGFYEDYFFSGLNGVLEADLSLGDTLTVATPPLKLTLISVDAGLPATNLELDFQIERSSQALLIPSFHADAVGGTLTGDNLRYDPNAASNTFTLRFTGLDLAQMLTLVEYKGVAATGQFSGEIPVTISKDGVVVTGGILRADDPGGTIRYLDGAAAAVGNPELALVNQVLSNFQFQTLSSSIDYTPTGELQLGMQLQGHNPDLGSDQPINLNLNLSDNVPALLESLRAARNIEEFLQEQYRNAPP